MPAAVVDRNFRCGKLRIGKRSDRDTDGFVAADFGMEHGRAAHRAESEQELRTLIADAEIFRRLADHFEWRRKAGERREHAARATLTSEAVADADTARLTLDFNAQLAAGA